MIILVLLGLQMKSFNCLFFLRPSILYFRVVHSSVEFFSFDKVFAHFGIVNISIARTCSIMQVQLVLCGVCWCNEDHTVFAPWIVHPFLF